MISVKYYSLIAKLTSLIVVIAACVILSNDVLPILISHPNSELIYTSKFGFQLFFQIINSYLLFFFGLLLSGRSRTIWQIALVMLLIACGCNIFLWQNYFAVTVTAVAFILLLSSHKIYNHGLFISYGRIFFAGLLIFALLYGVIGVYLLRNDFVGIKSLHDAIYFCIVTYSTVGYGDIYPQSPIAKYFVISLIVVGIAIFTSSVTLIVYNMDSVLKKILNNINKGKIGMNNHIVLIGYGILAKTLIQQYKKDKKEFLVMDITTNLDYDRQALFDEKRLLITPYMGHTESLLMAQLELAKKIIIAFDTDEATIFATMNTKEYLESKNLATKPQIISRILYDENSSKAKRAGADIVVSPYKLAAQQIMNETETI